MELIDAIRGRRSIRSFKDKPVPLELVREVLDSANYAPSAKRGEQWRFTVLTGDAKARFLGFFDEELDRFIEEHGVKEAGSSKNSCRIMDQAPVLVVVWNSGEYGWTTACPSLSKGEFLYDHGDTGRLTPLLKMFTLGHEFIPDPIHAGGLRYHGMAPAISLLVRDGLVKVKAYNQLDALGGAVTFTRAEGLIPAPETAHAVKATIDEALRCKETGEEKTILTLFSGHGFFDMAAYEAYLGGGLKPFELPDERIRETVGNLKRLYPFA